MTPHLRIAPLTLVLAAFVLVLAVAGFIAGWSLYLAAQPRFHGLETLFDLAAENNVPTWYSTVLLTLAALAAGMAGATAWRAGERGAWRWWALAAGLAGISLLEDASLVERLVWFTSSGRRFGLPQGSLRVVAVAVLALAGGVYAPLLSGQPLRRAILFVGSAVIMLGGHACFSALGGWMVWHGGVHQAGFVLARVAEETCKMLGTTLLLYATLAHLRQRGEVRFILA